MLQTVTPVFRIFDLQKAKEFYIDWLEFKIEWEHRFDENSPVYMEISKELISIHLTEHHGDSTPGSSIFIRCSQVEAYCDMLNRKKYKFYKPGIEKTFYNTLCIEVKDPFGNKLSFNEYL